MNAGMPRGYVQALLGFALSDEQWQCVAAPLEPFVIVAGAGTGKTTVMAARVLWLVGSGLVAADAVLGLTFTNRAAGELAGRVDALLRAWRAREHAADPALGVGQPGVGQPGVGQPGVGQLEVGQGEPTIATYHAFAGRLLDEQGLRIGVEPGSRLLAAPAVAQLAGRVVRHAEGLRAWRVSPSRLAQALLQLDANLAEQAISTEDLRDHDRAVLAEIGSLAKPVAAVRQVADTATRRLELADLVDKLRAERQRVGGIDFTDQMRLCLNLVESSPDLVGGLRRRYQVVLLDEYQDTSITQRMILSIAFAGTPVTAVGDPLQAIYGWRSASVANIDSFAEHFGREGAAPVRVLRVNRRSGEPILAVANRVAADLRTRHSAVDPLRAPAPRPGVLRAALLDTVTEEREWLADRVAEVVAAGTAPSDIGVLARANADLPPLRRALVARGVPASIVGSQPIGSSPWAASVLATLRLLADPADNVAAVELLAGPRWRIGTADLAALGRRARALAVGAQGGDESRDWQARLAEVATPIDPLVRPSLLEAASDPGPAVSPEARLRLAGLVSELRVLHAMAGLPVGELVRRVARLTGARAQADLAAARAGEGPDPGLAGLVDLADGFTDADGGTGLVALLAHLATADELGGEHVPTSVAPGSVQLMTVHKAKGLEFPVVVCPHLCRGAFPADRPTQRWTTAPSVVPVELRDDQHVLPRLNELTGPGLVAFAAACREHDRTGDDRLAYVALTRARDVLIASGHWWGPSQRTPRGPSPYLLAIRAELDEPDRDPWASPPEPEDGEQAAGNPLLDEVADVPWPQDADAYDAADRVAAVTITALRDAADRGQVGGSAGGQTLTPGGEQAATTGGERAPTSVGETIAAWDTAIAALHARSGLQGAGLRSIPVPDSLSASDVLELARDPDAYAARLARPMPRPPSPAAALGTAFHAWVEGRMGAQLLLTDDELPGAADAGWAEPVDLAPLMEAFERLTHAHRAPAGLEVPFRVSLAGRVVRGRIDAVFPAAPGDPEEQLWEVVDWKTSASDRADPLQLALYRVAWAQLAGVPISAVGASFVHVRSGLVRRVDDLPDADALAAILDRPGPVTGRGSRPAAPGGR